MRVLYKLNYTIILWSGDVVMLKKCLLGSSLICLTFFSQFSFATVLKEINPPEPKTYTCPDIPTTFTIGHGLGDYSGWIVKSDNLASGTKVTLDQDTTVEYIDITAVTWFGANAVQCNYKIIDSKANVEYGLNIFNWDFVKDCYIAGPKSMTCLPA